MSLSTLHFLVGIGVAALLAYLFYSMMRPEDFE